MATHGGVRPAGGSFAARRRVHAPQSRRSAFMPRVAVLGILVAVLAARVPATVSVKLVGQAEVGGPTVAERLVSIGSFCFDTSDRGVALAVLLQNASAREAATVRITATPTLPVGTQSSLAPVMLFHRDGNKAYDAAAEVRELQRSAVLNCSDLAHVADRVVELPAPVDRMDVIWHQSRPQCWDVTLAACDLVLPATVEYRLHFRNPGGFWRKEFSYDRQWLLEAFIAAAGLHLLLLVVSVASFVRNRASKYKAGIGVVACSVLLDLLGYGLLVLQGLLMANDAGARPGLETAAMWLVCAGRVVLQVMLIMFMGGWLVSPPSDWLAKRTRAMAAVALIVSAVGYGLFLGWSGIGIKPSKGIIGPIWGGGGTIALLSARALLVLWGAVLLAGFLKVREHDPRPIERLAVWQALLILMWSFGGMLTAVLMSIIVNGWLVARAVGIAVLFFHVIEQAWAIWLFSVQRMTLVAEGKLAPKPVVSKARRISPTDPPSGDSEELDRPSTGISVAPPRASLTATSSHHQGSTEELDSGERALSRASSARSVRSTASAVAALKAGGEEMEVGEVRDRPHSSGSALRGSRKDDPLNKLRRKESSRRQGSRMRKHESKSLRKRESKSLSKHESKSLRKHESKSLRKHESKSLRKHESKSLRKRESSRMRRSGSRSPARMAGSADEGRMARHGSRSPALKRKESARRSASLSRRESRSSMSRRESARDPRRSRSPARTISGKETVSTVRRAESASARDGATMSKAARRGSAALVAGMRTLFGGARDNVQKIETNSVAVPEPEAGRKPKRYESKSKRGRGAGGKHMKKRESSRMSRRESSRRDGGPSRSRGRDSPGNRSRSKRRSLSSSSGSTGSGSSYTGSSYSGSSGSDRDRSRSRSTSRVRTRDTRAMSAPNDKRGTAAASNKGSKKGSFRELLDDGRRKSAGAGGRLSPQGQGTSMEAAAAKRATAGYAGKGSARSLLSEGSVQELQLSNPHLFDSDDNLSPAPGVTPVNMVNSGHSLDTDGERSPFRALDGLDSNASLDLSRSNDDMMRAIPGSTAKMKGQANMVRAASKFKISGF